MKLNTQFTAKLQKSPKKGGHIFVIWQESSKFFGTRGLVKVKGWVDNFPFQSAFIPLGDGNHKLPIKLEIRKSIGKVEGDEVKIRFDVRLI